MSTGIWAAASGAVAQGHALDVAANNIANANTVGFRAERSVFHQELARASGSDASRSLRYSVTRSAEPDLTLGRMERTGRPLDVALPEPNAWFTVQTARGERFTRAGGMVLTQDGRVTTPDGEAYLGPDRKPIVLDPQAKSVAITQRGTFLVDGIETSQRLAVVTFPNPRGLEKDGHLLVRPRGEAGRPREVELRLEVETLERSNAPAVASMTELVTTTRQFELLTRVIEAFSTADRRAATDIVGSK